jgi:diacylglycerol kinase
MPNRWKQKFGHAFRGLRYGIRGQDSFWVHLPAAIAVLLLGILLRLQRWEWCAVLVCIAIVVAAELGNTAIEMLVRRLHPERHQDVGQALDTAAAAVLVVSLAAVLVGCIVFIGAALRIIDPG